MTPGQRRWVFLAAGAGLAAFYLWGLSGLPGFGTYPGPYGPAILGWPWPQTQATGVVSAVNFEYRGFDTVGEEFILFSAAAGSVGRAAPTARRAGTPSAVDEAADRDVPPTSDAVRHGGADLHRARRAGSAGGWPRTRRPDPSGGFQGGVVLATAFVMIYLAGRVPGLPAVQPGRAHRRGGGGRGGRVRRRRAHRGRCSGCRT